MKCRVLLAVLVGISLVLAVTIHFHQAANAKLEQSLAILESLPKVDLDRFRSDAKEFYQHTTKPARDERKRLRRLYNQIQNDPESERLTKTMNQYVDWVISYDDPSLIRGSQTRPINERVEIIQKAVLEERSNTISESPVTIERLKASLPPELQLVVLSPLFNAFDAWLTKRFDETKSALKPILNEQQIKNLPEFLSEFEEFYRDLFHRAGIETSSATKTGIPEKLAMIPLIQNLGSPPRMGGGGFLRPGGGGPRPGGGGGPFPFEGGGLRGDFLKTIDDAIESKDSNPFLDSLAPSEKQALENLENIGRPVAPRMEALQGLLALAVLERYPMAADSWRFFLANSREEQDSIKLLGNYLFMMKPMRREEFLKMDSRYMILRLQSELQGNVSPFFWLIIVRSNRDRSGTPGMGGPPSPMPPPPRGDSPPDLNFDMPPRPENRQGRNQGQ